MTGPFAKALVQGLRATNRELSSQASADSREAGDFIEARLAELMGDSEGTVDGEVRPTRELVRMVFALRSIVREFADLNASTREAVEWIEGELDGILVWTPAARPLAA